MQESKSKLSIPDTPFIHIIKVYISIVPFLSSVNLITNMKDIVITSLDIIILVPCNQISNKDVVITSMDNRILVQ